MILPAAEEIAMSRWALLCTFVICLAFAGGCGSRLTHTNVHTFRLGETTEKDLRDKFGKPDMAEERGDGAGLSRTMRWRGEPGTPGFGSLNDIRYLVAETYNGRLRAWLFASSAPGAGRSKFNEANVSRLVEGQTTREQAAQLLGDPAGKAIRGTLIPDYRNEFGPNIAEIWAWIGIRGKAFSNEVTLRMHLVKFDTSGRVVESATRTFKG